MATAGDLRRPFVVSSWPSDGTRSAIMPEQLGRFLLIAGLVVAGAGILLLAAGKLGIGRLPGDLVWEGEGWTVYVPLGWMVLISVVLTLLLNLLSGGGD